MAKGGGLDIGTLAGHVELQDHVSSTLDLIAGKIDRLDTKFGGMGKRVAESAAGFFTADAAMRAVHATMELVVDLAKDLEEGLMTGADIEENFNRLTAASGRLGDTLLGKLRDSTHNTIDDLDLMKRVNADLAAGMDLTDQQFQTLAEGAYALSQATGGTVKDAFDTMSEAMLTGRTRALAVLTGKIDLAAAEDAYARKLGVSTEKLSADGKMHAAREAILHSVGGAIERLGEQQEGFDERIDQAAAFYRNFMDELGKTISLSPVIMAGIDGIGGALNTAFGGETEGLIEGIVRGIENAAMVALEWAQTVVDAVAIAGSTWNSLQIILETVAQGYRAITYLVEGLGLMLVKVGTLGADTAWSRALEEDMDRLYDSMAAGDAAITKHREEQDQWAVSTGHLNDQIEAIRQRMIKAREEQDKLATSAIEVSNANKLAAVGAEIAAKAEGDHAHVLAQTSEEMKKQRDALAEIASSGKTWQETLKGLNTETVQNVKTYLAAGVAQGTLAAAYGLTTTQVTAISKALTAEQEAQKKSIDATKEKTEALAELAILTQNHDLVLARIPARILQQAKAWLEADASLTTVQKALGLTDSQTKALEVSLEAADKKARALAEGGMGKMGDAAESLENKVRSLTKQIELSMGGQFNIEPLSKAQIAAQGGEKVLRAEVARIEASYAQFPGRKPGGNGPTGVSAGDAKGWAHLLEEQQRYLSLKASGFRTGGFGDFGAGTLVELHGKELITPWDKAMDHLGGRGTPAPNVFYVNGTAEESARKISDILMRQASVSRQFGRA